MEVPGGYRGTIHSKTTVDGKSSFEIHYDDDGAHSAAPHAEPALQSRAFVAEEQAARTKKSVDEYRRLQGEASPEQFSAVKGSDFIVPVDPLLNEEQLISQYNSFKQHAVRLKQDAGSNANTARRFAIWLLGNDVHLPAARFPDLRALLQIMLVIPASSAQSERDFSAQVRLRTPTICSRRATDLALSLR